MEIENIKAGREAAGMSQDSLCRKAHIPRWRIALHEQGIEPLGPEELERCWAAIRRAFEVRAAQIEAAKQAVSEIGRQ